MKKVAIFGGSFNPVHRGHEQITAEILAKHIADEVWLLPVGKHAFAKDLAPAKNRLAMLEIMRRPFGRRARLCDYELKQPLSITYQTLRALQTKYPDIKFSFVMGGDQLTSFEKWHDYNQLAREFEILVYPRLTAGSQALLSEENATTQIAGQQQLCAKYHLHFLADFPLILTSSTLARAAAAKDSKTLRHLVGDEVADYIITHNLY